jgi:hypothetical protein
MGHSLDSWEKQVPPLCCPEFLSRLVALAEFMRLSLMKAAHLDLSGAAYQEFGYASLLMNNPLGQNLRAHRGAFVRGKGAQQVPPLRCAPVGMTRGRGRFQVEKMAEQKPFFITLGGPQAMNTSVGMTKLLGTEEKKRGKIIAHKYFLKSLHVT